MTSLKNIVFGCVSDHGSEANVKLSKIPFDRPLSLQRIRFGLTLEEAFKDNIPVQLMDMLVYIARDGITTTDLFRRPGNPTDLKQIVKRLADGRDIDYASYNFYTLASVIKKFLLKIPGGIFGSEAENELLKVLNIKEPIYQFDAINKVIRSLPKVSQELISMLFGTWFRMAHHSEFNSMSSESVAKSVAGSLFHTCADDPNMVNLASNVLQILIENFAASPVFGRDNIEFFARATRTQIDVLEKYKYELDSNFVSLFSVKNSEEERNGGVGMRKKDIPSIEEYLALFERVVAHDAKLRGIDTASDAITPNQFSSLISDPFSMVSNRISMASSLPTPHMPKMNVTPSSPQSLQPASKNRDPQDHNSLSSYLSAPDVYEGIDQPQNEILTKSLSRVESVYRKQLMRLRQRNNWFLNCTSTPTSMDSRFSRSPQHHVPSSTVATSNTNEISVMSSSFSCGVLSSNLTCTSRSGENTSFRAQLQSSEPQWSVSSSTALLPVHSFISSTIPCSNVEVQAFPPVFSTTCEGRKTSEKSLCIVATCALNIDDVKPLNYSSMSWALNSTKLLSTSGNMNNKMCSQDINYRCVSSKVSAQCSHTSPAVTMRSTPTYAEPRQLSSIPIFTVTQATNLITSLPPARYFKVERCYGFVGSYNSFDDPVKNQNLHGDHT